MLDQNLLMEFSKVINEGKDKTKKEYNVYGTVSRVDGDTAYVKIDGSSIETPMPSSVSTLIGNRVSVRISDHSAIVTGNISDPSASKTEVDTIGSVATDASASANEAKSTAQSASATATAASGKADEASTVAASAKSTAEGAASTAQSAFAKATEADGVATAASAAATAADTRATNAFNKATEADGVARAASAAATAADTKATNASTAADAAKKVATNYIVQNNNGITLGNASGGSMVGGQVNLNANGMSIINGQGNEVANYSNTTRIGFQSGHNVKIDNDSVDVCSGDQVDATFGSTTRIGVSAGHNVKIDDDSVDICSGDQVDATFGSTTRIGVQYGHNVKISGNSVDVCSGSQVDATFGSTTRIGVSAGHNVKIDDDSVDICSGDQVNATFGSESIILRDEYGNDAVKLSVSGLVKQLISQGRIITTTSRSLLPFPRAETISPSKNLSRGYYLVRNTNTTPLTGSISNNSYIIKLNASFNGAHTITYSGPLLSSVKLTNSSTDYTVGYFDVDENCDSVLDVKGLINVNCENLFPNTYGEISNGLVIGKTGSDQTVITPGWIFARSSDGSSYEPRDLYINPSGGRVSFGGLDTYIDMDDDNSAYIQTEALRLGFENDAPIGRIGYVSSNAGNNLNFSIDTAKMMLVDGSSYLIMGTDKNSIVMPNTVCMLDPKVGNETTSKKLYYTKNDTMSIAGLRTAGVLTRTNARVYNIRFTIFLSKPYYNATNVSITNGGYKLRTVSTNLSSSSKVSGQYLFGGDASTNVTPSTTTCTLSEYGVNVTLAFSFTEDHTEIYNAPVAIEIGSGTLTFS